MRSSIVRAFALGVIAGSFLTAGGILLATPAKADAASEAYAVVYGPIVCDVLDDYPSFSGILGIGKAIADDGLSFTQAGEVIAIAVTELCPRHLRLVWEFAETANQGAVA